MRHVPSAVVSKSYPGNAITSLYLEHACLSTAWFDLGLSLRKGPTASVAGITAARKRGTSTSHPAVQARRHRRSSSRQLQLPYAESRAGNEKSLNILKLCYATARSVIYSRTL